jgi:uncharacterized protein
VILMSLAALSLASLETDEATFRTNRETSLKAERGWLSVAGLFWLKEGENTIGSDANSAVVLPSYAPTSYGTLVRTGSDIVLRVPGEPDRPLKSDAKGGPDRIKVGDATFTVIERGTRIGVRLYDPHSQAQQEFQGLKWFPASAKYVVEAKYTPYEVPKTLKIINVLGDSTDVPCPGYVEFKLDGKTGRLDVQDEGDELFLNFQDATSGKETYGAGRFLYADKPKDGVVKLNFNRVTNPPCAYTAYATCPLPPKGNRLPMAIHAGEKAHHPPEPK